MKRTTVFSLLAVLLTPALAFAQGEPAPSALQAGPPPRTSKTIVGDVDDRPGSVVTSTQTAPFYPKQLRDAGIKGEVIVEVTVDRQNNVSEPRVIKSDRAELDLLALEAVLGWEYEAAIVNGQMVKSRVLVTVKFDPDAKASKKNKAAKTSGKPDKNLPPEYQYDEAPVAVRILKPVYPYELLVKSKTGRATVTFVVDPAGNARDAQVKSASEPEFGAALAAMAEVMEFEPATKAGKPCWALLSIEKVFNQISPDSPVDGVTKELLSELEQSSPKIHTPAELDAKLKPVYRVGPALTDALLKSGESAAAEIEIIIDHNGRARLPRIVSATSDDFGWAAATAVSRWVFDPALKNGEPVYVRVKVPIKYTPPKK
jgi:TonB family protein